MSAVKDCCCPFIPFFVLFITALIAFSDAAAQMDSSTKLPDAIVVSHADKSTPVTFQDIDGKALKTQSVGQEPAAILSGTPSVTFYSDAGIPQGYVYYRLRGIDQTRINTTFDGLPMNEPEDQGAYFSNYPDILNSVSNLQIQRGVGLSKAGVASYGGSLQLQPPDLTAPASAAFGAGYGSFNSYRIFGEGNIGVKNNAALYARASALHADGYKFHSPNTAQSAFVSARLSGKASSWRLNILAGHQRNGLAWLGVDDSAISSDNRSNANAEGEQDDFTQVLIQLKHKWLSRSSRWSSEAGLYYGYLDGHYTFDLANFLALPPDGALYKYAFKSALAGLSGHLSYTANGFSFTTGLHGNLYNRQHAGSEQNIGELYKNKGIKNEGSAFIKLDYTIRRWHFLTDLQYRFTAFRYEGAVSIPAFSWSFFSPKAGLSCKLSAGNTYLYYTLGFTGREPTRNDIFMGADNLEADSAGNPLLGNAAAEYVADHELGIRKSTKSAGVSLNAYYMNFRNEIVLNGKLGPNGLALTNAVTQSYRSGIELSVYARVGQHIRLSNNSSYSYSRIREQGISFTPILTPVFIVNQELSYTMQRVTLSLTGRCQSGSYLDFANSATIPPYVLLNAMLRYAAGKHWDVSLFLNNLTNVHYYNNGYVGVDGRRKLFVQAPFSSYFSLKYAL